MWGEQKLEVRSRSWSVVRLTPTNRSLFKTGKPAFLFCDRVPGHMGSRSIVRTKNDELQDCSHTEGTTVEREHWGWWCRTLCHTSNTCTFCAFSTNSLLNYYSWIKRVLRFNTYIKILEQRRTKEAAETGGGEKNTQTAEQMLTQQVNGVRPHTNRHTHTPCISVSTAAASLLNWFIHG